MANKNGKAYGLTALCPILPGGPAYRDSGEPENRSHATVVRDTLQDLKAGEASPLVNVPNTYFCRFYVLDDVTYQGYPAKLDHLKSRYLVFAADFHGELEPYLTDLWNHAEPMVQSIWKYCVAFDQVQSAADFVAYIQRCQVKTTYYFNGSTDDSLAEQLKSLYLKQEFSRFAFENQGLPSSELRTAFAQFVARTAPADLADPTWPPGKTTL